MPRNTPGMKAEAIDLSIAAAGSKATYVGAGVTGLGWGNYKGKPLRGLMLRREREYHEAISAASDAELYSYDINAGWPA